MCGSLNTNAAEAAAAAATRSVAHRMCAIVYVFFYILYFRTYFRVCEWVDKVCGLPIGLGDFVRIVLESINIKMINSLHGKIF